MHQTEHSEDAVCSALVKVRWRDNLKRLLFVVPMQGSFPETLLVCSKESSVLECSKRCVDGIRVTFFMKITEIGCR